jgi:hypothetical protein
MGVLHSGAGAAGLTAAASARSPDSRERSAATVAAGLNKRRYVTTFTLNAFLHSIPNNFSQFRLLTNLRARVALSRKHPTTGSSLGFVSIGENLVDIGGKVADLSDLAESAAARAAESEERCLAMKAHAENLEEKYNSLTKKCSDLKAITDGNAKQKVVAARLISLSEELSQVKLSTLQQRRQIQVLHQEKRHYQAIIANIEADVVELEEGKIRAETKVGTLLRN